MSQNDVTLTSLSEAISEMAKALVTQLQSSNAAAPSFAEDAPSDYPPTPEVAGLRLRLIDAAADMFYLAMGPGDMAFAYPIHLNYDATVLDIFHQFDFFSAVPLGASATYAEIAEKTSVPESLVRRLLKYALTIRLFAEEFPGSEHIVHTSLSAVYVKRPLLRSWIDHFMSEARPGTVHLAESIRTTSLGKKRASEDLLTTGFALANIDRLERPEGFISYLSRNVTGKPEGYRATKISEAMQVAATSMPVKVEELLRTSYDWSKLGAATILDVGGSSGHDAIVLSQAFPDLKFIVQDLPEVETSFNKLVPAELKHRIKFHPHDFFTPQTQHGDAILLKHVLHDWPSEQASNILKNLMPTVKPGSKIILCEVVVPPASVPLPRALRRVQAGADLQMLMLMNALERSIEQWAELMKQVDDKLEITHVSTIAGAMYSMIEVTYQG